MSGYVRTIRPGDALVYVVWELTLRCDLACWHCGSRAGKPRADELTTDEALSVVRQLAEMGAREVTLIGGEVYLRPDWHVIARAIGDAGMACTITTGGRHFTAERARLAREAGVRGASVSLDGLGATHDRQRGVRGAFDSAVAALRNLREAGIPISANTQVNRLSFPELDGLLDLLVAKGATAWQVQLTVPMGRAVENADWFLQPWELLEVVPKIAELRTRGLERGVRLWAGDNVGYFGPHESTFRGDESYPGAYGAGCSAGKHSLGLEADGTVKGCASLPTREWAGGNVRERPIREIWDRAKPLRWVRDRTVEDLWGYCRTCYYADPCFAGCTWTSHVFLGKPGNNPYCHHRALEHDRKGLRERLTLVKAAPGVPFDQGAFEISVEPVPAAALDHRAPGA